MAVRRLDRSPPGIDLPALLRESAEAAVEAAAAAADVDATSSIADGDPEAVLTELSGDAQLLVLGARGTGGVAGLLLGSTAARVVAHARCPVVVLPDGTSVAVRGRRSVVVGIAGGPGDDDVLAFAFAEAAARGTDLLAVHAWRDVVPEPSWPGFDPGTDGTGAGLAEEHLLAELLAPWRDKEPDVEVREVVVRERPARALLAAAMTAELLVVGHRPGRSFGSTTYGVLHKAGCPVAVVPLLAGARR